MSWEKNEEIKICPYRHDCVGLDIFDPTWDKWCLNVLQLNWLLCRNCSVAELLSDKFKMNYAFKNKGKIENTIKSAVIAILHCARKKIVSNNVSGYSNPSAR